ncbi:MAG: DUF4157 domain-containing protein, partial [Planctomycetes bacterium]|nr:DUF4157 domain-containing protein [Planctomycetota bacterium]
MFDRTLARTLGGHSDRTTSTERGCATPRSIATHHDHGKSIALGARDDRLEHDADRLADAALRDTESSTTPRFAFGRSGNGAGTIEAPDSVRAVLRAPGRPLEPPTRSYFESRFGHDFGHIRVHTDSRAARSAAAIGARAYAYGRDIAFAATEYGPSTRAGRRLLAHELAHTLQPEAALVVRRIPQNPSDTPFTAQILPWSAALRDTPSPNGKTLADLPRGQLVTVKSGRAWIEVETVFGGNKLTGYVSHELLKRLDQRTGTELPDAAKQRQIGAKLDPGA